MTGSWRRPRRPEPGRDSSRARTWRHRARALLVTAVVVLISPPLQAGPAQANATEPTPDPAIAANPAAVNIVAGSGWLGKKPRAFGVGFTGFHLIRGRPADAIGGGLAWSWLNQDRGFRNDETLIQFYYQAQIVDNLYLQPVFTYVPNPGASPALKPPAIVTVQTTVLF